MKYKYTLRYNHCGEQGYLGARTKINWNTPSFVTSPTKWFDSEEELIEYYKGYNPQLHNIQRRKIKDK